jgi:hypothetical protein
MLTGATEVRRVHTAALETKCEIGRNMFRAVEDIACSPIGAAFEIADLIWTEFSAARLTLLVDKGDEFVHDGSLVVTHVS